MPSKESKSEAKAVAKKKSGSSRKPTGDKKKITLGLDLGTLYSCYVDKLPKQDSEDSIGTIVPTVVGYAEEGILSGILPGNSSTLFGNDALTNELHVRLAHPLSDGVVSDVA